MPTYGQTIIWHDQNGSKYSMSVEGKPSQDLALEECLADAIQFGWTPPRWWQWWRWHDTRISGHG